VDSVDKQIGMGTHVVKIVIAQVIGAMVRE